MKNMLISLLAKLLVFPLFIACTSQDNTAESRVRASLAQSASTAAQMQLVQQSTGSGSFIEDEDFFLTLDRIAEVERSDAFFQGLGFFESAFRAEAGDYSGALIAAYKDLSWAYGHSEIPKAAMEEGINQHALALQAYADVSAGNALAGILAFMNESWDEAASLLKNEAPRYREIDSFYEWMLLVCAMESGEADSLSRNKYSAIRARYTLFPEYWYRGARGLKNEQAAIFAEHCINLNPSGPFALECRTILAGFHGLESYAANILTTTEIEDIVRISVSETNPGILSSLFPMMEMPDNNYTHYVIGALRTLAAIPLYRDYFIQESSRYSGRLAERLLFISRG